MAKPLSILFVTSEAYPYIKSGGIADVSYSLPMALRDLGHDIRIMLPKYGTVSERRNRIHEINRLRDIPIPMGKLSEPATVKSSSVFNPRTKVQAYITTNLTYFDALKGIYHDPKTGKEFPNNAERFAFFSRTVVETCMLLGWYPDLIHCNGWHTAFIPGFVRGLFANKFKKTKLVLTIHNFKQQGEYQDFNMSLTGFPKEVQSHYIQNKKINILKGGIYYSDFVTTVSPGYAKQILTDKEHGGGLGTSLKEKGSRFLGLLNGIDTYTWNPRQDDYLKHKMRSDFEEFKYNNKVELIKKIGWEYKPDVPLIGMISRLEEQKGTQLLLDSLEAIFKEKVQIVLLGLGEQETAKAVAKAEKKYSAKFKFFDEFNEQLAHLIEAGSDMFLMPSLYEPCGLNAMYSMVYGSIPIVHLTGGLANIVTPIDQKTMKGNTFVFNKFDTPDMVLAIKTAAKCFKDKELWETLIKNATNEDFTWSKSAQKYSEIYKELMK
ncbi:MAG: hypothetical protein HW421_2885 [Ignavibacteria bacterium]|nr:hypothetical protein [Ignavibacteria bacterium]